ncbi:phosphoribosylamine--glycine ligase [Ligilactobacillus sp. WILCCON 0076]|uniref:Phosphoribosylamine--glycine ligase n=1 Tax=Ligilactobacillus ubinensis TaxID=2876789 RepID=A0A9X2FL65_9LACO|nr:phosphoribosylamine--glycine ligase [Ligilactobacillus ubinensis]MCP0886761.1 phosphoribosylamine--glycine ligase [Ligilactobacillus ubinensis]
MKDDMKLLIVGSGGREHAIAKALLKSSHVASVFCAPGNIGMEADGIKTIAINELDFDALKGFVYEEQIDWTFVGPEDALVAGIVDSFEADGLKIFGPNAKAAQLEGSKDYAMRFMDTYDIPTARFATFKNSRDAIEGLKNFDAPIVIKADGLASGKGVVISDTKKKAAEQISLMFKKGQKQIVIEEFLDGEEYSLFVVVGKDDYRILPMAQDHKRAYDADKGPNTGGMGAYSPIPQLSNADYKRMLAEVVKPTITGLKEAKLAYRGIIYIGMILTKQGPKVIEYNVRLGDPETQVVLLRVKNDFAELIDAVVNNYKLPIVTETKQACLGVVIAAQGYPSQPINNQKIPIFSKNEIITIDYANVKGTVENLYGNGGRLLTVIASAATLEKAQSEVYKYLSETKLEQCFYRKDIGYRATQKTY